MNKDKVGCVIAGIGVAFAVLGCMLNLTTQSWGWVLLNLAFVALNARNFLYHYRRLGK